jgi:hypothetical protein
MVTLSVDPSRDAGMTEKPHPPPAPPHPPLRLAVDGPLRPEPPPAPPPIHTTMTKLANAGFVHVPDAVNVWMFRATGIPT